MSWDEIYNQTKRELGHEPRSEEVQKRMVEAEFDIDSIFHKTTKQE